VHGPDDDGDLAGDERARVGALDREDLAYLAVVADEEQDLVLDLDPAQQDGAVAVLDGVDLVAGGLVGRQKLIDQIRMMRNTIGTICDPNTAWMLLRSLETLELRMERAGLNAERVCAFLRDHPKVESVGYLGFLEEGSRQADIYKRHCTGAGSTFSLYLKGGEKEAFAFLDSLKIAHLAVSLGGTETLASAPAAMTHLSVPDERKQALGITDNLVRISIGVEDPDDLIADFDNALRSV
jgi:methionine-gamma-lyase